MKKIILKILVAVLIFAGTANFLYSQELEDIKLLPYTSVKDQAMSGTCWCFSVISMLESELMKKGIEYPDLSEMFVVRNIYFDKAQNYILRQGFTRFAEGAFTHDVIPAIEKYGIVPQSVFKNSDGGKINHIGYDAKLKKFLDSVIAKTPISPDWKVNFNKMLDEKFGESPKTFIYEGKEYTPKQFAEEVLQFKSSDFIGLTSYTHHPFYKPFNVEVPDNYSGGLFYNVPVDELIEITKDAVLNGYTVGWDSDVSNDFFNQKAGFAMIPEGKNNLEGKINPDDKEVSYTQQSRQELFEILETQDDHLMHLVGLKKSKDGKTFFFVKNSWGEVGPFKGFINVSETYFGINTITIVLPVSALKPEVKAKLGI